MNTPAVVVIAYSRPATLARLLTSLARADYPPGVAVPLLISIDGGPRQHRDVVAAAEEAAWSAGPKEIVAHESNLGLIDHYLWAGEQSERFGAVALLEDDQVVSARWHAFATAALDAVGDDARVAQVNLGAPWFNGFTGDPFDPLDDGADTFYGRFPFMGGAVVTADGWRRLRPVLEAPIAPVALRDLHPAWSRLRADEWLPRLAAHLASAGRHVLYPRVALSVPWGDAGTHFTTPTRYFQVPLARRRAAWTIHPLDSADSVYDQHQELDAGVARRLSPHLASVDLEMDLWAIRPRHAVRAAHVVTTRPAARSIASYGAELRPLEANVLEGVPGTEIHLARAEDVDWSPRGARHARSVVAAWATRDRRPSVAGVARDAMRGAVDRLSGR